MARHDIMPYEAAHGGHDHVVHHRMGALSTAVGANTSWQVGDVLLLAVATGDIDIIVDGTCNITTNHYIAAASSAGLLTHFNGVSGAATHDIMVPCYPLTGPNASSFYTERAHTGTDTLLTAAEMVALFVGDTVGLYRDNTATDPVAFGPAGRFGVDSAATGMKILRQLDALGRDVVLSGADCTAWVVGTNA